MSRPDHVLLDIDHTIADAAWRDHLLGRWDEYHAEGIKDEPIWPVVRLARALAEAGHVIVGLTARPERWRALTVTWLVQSGIGNIMDEMLMRPNDNYMPSPECKMLLARERFGDDLSESVSLVIDDREDVLAAFREVGLVTIRVSAGRPLT